MTKRVLLLQASILQIVSFAVLWKPFDIVSFLWRKEIKLQGLA